MKILLSGIGSVGLLLGALALAQTDTDEVPDDLTVQEGSLDDLTVEEEALDSVDSEADVDPLAELAAQEEALAEQAAATADEELDQDGFGEAQLDAVLDRFDPSEKISEDKSVSFPNDI